MDARDPLPEETPPSWRPMVNYRITLARTISDQYYGGNAFENHRMEITVEGNDADALRDEAKGMIEEWTGMLVRDIECETWGLTVDQWNNLNEEAKAHLQEAKKAIGRVRYHQERAKIHMKKVGPEAVDF